jgi:hypothetical protein
MHELTQAWLGLIVDISVKSILLAVVAGVALFAWRVRDTNLHHRVWTAVLFGMLAMPVLVFVTPPVPLPRWLNVVILEASAEARPVGNTADGRRAAVPPLGATNLPPDTIPVAAPRSAPFSDAAMSAPLPPAPCPARKRAFGG